MKCPNCGAELVGKYCAYCGTENVNYKEPEKCCPKCRSTDIEFEVLNVYNSVYNPFKLMKDTNKLIGYANHFKCDPVDMTIGRCKKCRTEWLEGGGKAKRSKYEFNKR